MKCGPVVLPDFQKLMFAVRCQILMPHFLYHSGNHCPQILKSVSIRFFWCKEQLSANLSWWSPNLTNYIFIFYNRGELSEEIHTMVEKENGWKEERAREKETGANSMDFVNLIQKTTVLSHSLQFHCEFLLFSALNHEAP